MALHHPNPFRPGTAASPPYLAGREELRSQLDTNVSTHGNNYGSFLIVHGTRGMGKTALLRLARDRAAEHGWAVVFHEAKKNAPFLHSLLREVEQLQGLPDRLVSKVRQVRAEWSEQEQEVNLKVYRRSAKRQAQPLPITDVLTETLLSIVEHQTDRAAGLLLAVDEAQYIDPLELAPLGPFVQRVSETASLTASVVLTGLPTLPSRLDEAFTYSERWKVRPLRSLDEHDVAAALSVPADQSGKPFTAVALAEAVAPTKGYPFAVQLMGFHAWNAAAGTKITDQDVAAASQEFRVDMAHSLYTGRWTNAPGKLGRAYLAAAAIHATDGTTTTEAITTALAREHTQLSSTRQALLDEGTIISPGYGMVEEGIPGLFDHIRHQPDVQDALEQVVDSATETLRRLRQRPVSGEVDGLGL